MKKEIKKGIRIGAIFFVMLGFLFGYSLMTNIKTSDDYASIYFDFPVALGAETDPGAGNGGILSVYFLNYTGGQTPPTTNDSSLLESWASTVGYVGYNNTTPFQQQIKHDTSFMIVVRVRGNANQCKRGNVWYDSDLRITWKCTGFGVSDGTQMTGYVTHNDSNADYLWMNFVDDNNGNGYTLSKDESVDIENIKFLAYY